MSAIERYLKILPYLGASLTALACNRPPGGPPSATSSTGADRDVPVARVDPVSGEVRIDSAALSPTLPNGMRVTSEEVLRIGHTYYLVRANTGGTACMTVGVPLADKGGSLVIARSKSNGVSTTTCTGDPCSSCKFTYDKTGDVVTGCKCDGPGKCNHTITTTTVSAFLAR